MGIKITMKDIAKKLNLSINAVSLVLNNKAGVSEETRSLVLKTADDMGYFDNKPKYLNSFASKNICLVLEPRFFNDPYFYSKVILGIEEESRKNSYDLIMNFIDGKNFTAPNCLESRKASGIIALGPLDDEYLLRLKNYCLPMVLVDNSSFIEPIDSILTDNKLGAYKATKYLINKGFEKIGFFGDLSYSLSIKERYFGYSEALRDSSLYGENLDEMIKRYSLTTKIEEFVIKHDVEAILQKLKKIVEMPEAFVCSNDSAAIQLNNALNLLGHKVPEEVSIIGFDDISLCNMIMPKLSTIKVNKELMGRKAVQRLLWRMRHKSDPVENTIMSVELVERESVKNRVFP